jgi:hypothetical protein
MSRNSEQQISLKQGKHQQGRQSGGRAKGPVAPLHQPPVVHHAPERGAVLLPAQVGGVVQGEARVGVV